MELSNRVKHFTEPSEPRIHLAVQNVLLKQSNFTKVLKMFFDAECTFKYTDGVVQLGKTLH